MFCEVGGEERKKSFISNFHYMEHLISSVYLLQFTKYAFTAI